MNEPSKFVTDMKTAVKHINDARQIMASGPLDYYFAKLVEHSEALLTRFAPIKTGEKAVIIQKIECKDDWRECEKTLAVGSIGTISETDYSDGRFTYHWVPDEEWWKDSDGKYHECDNRHSFHLAETKLAKVSDQPCQDTNS